MCRSKCRFHLHIGLRPEPQTTPGRPVNAGMVPDVGTAPGGELVSSGVTGAVAIGLEPFGPDVVRPTEGNRDGGEGQGEGPDAVLR